MEINELVLKDRKLFDRMMGLADHELSCYAFENIYIWKRLYDISWLLIKDSLCVFFRDKIGCFLYLPPLGKKIKPEVIEAAFKIMDGINRNADISRIENIEEKELGAYKRLGYDLIHKSDDYILSRAELAGLKGDKFKSKRSCVNYFVKNYDFEYLRFKPEYKQPCLDLFCLWQSQRKGKLQDKVYQGMMDDSLACLKILFNDYGDLNITGRLVKIGNDVKAFTFGYRLNPQTFCILYEITDLSVKGLAQFIFRRFSSELKEYRYINIMDDSGLENLKRVKLSYHPIKLVPAYIAKRKYE